MEETFGLAGSLSPEQVAQALEDHPGVKLVVYPSPTYDGVVSDTAGICATAHALSLIHIFRTLTAKLATMGVVMATISLLFTATLLSEGSGMVFSALFQNRMEKVSAFDLYIGTKDQAHLAAYQAYLNRAVPVTSARQYSIYQGENAQVTTYCLEKADYHQMCIRDSPGGAGSPGPGDRTVRRDRHGAAGPGQHHRLRPPGDHQSVPGGGNPPRHSGLRP